jgi:hypothetical protein
LQRALADSPIVSGNAVSLLPGGTQAFAAMFEALGQAVADLAILDVTSGMRPAGCDQRART